MGGSSTARLDVSVRRVCHLSCRTDVPYVARGHAYALRGHFCFVALAEFLYHICPPFVRVYTVSSIPYFFKTACALLAHCIVPLSCAGLAVDCRFKWYGGTAQV
jgi:hypothetical protein